MDDFSPGHLFLLKYPASFHETHEYDHSLLFHVKYQATNLECRKITGSLQMQALPTLTNAHCSFSFVISIPFFTPFHYLIIPPLSYPPHVRNFILTRMPKKQHVIP